MNGKELQDLIDEYIKEAIQECPICYDQMCINVVSVDESEDKMYIEFECQKGHVIKHTVELESEEEEEEGLVFEPCGTMTFTCTSESYEPSSSGYPNLQGGWQR